MPSLNDIIETPLGVAIFLAGLFIFLLGLLPIDKIRIKGSSLMSEPLGSRTRWVLGVLGFIFMMWPAIAQVVGSAIAAMPTLTATPTNTPTNTPMATITPTMTATPTATAAPTEMPTSTPTPTPTPTPTSTPTLTQGEVIVDDQDIGFTKYGTENNWKTANIGYNEHMVWTLRGDSLDNWAQWCPQLPASGLYRVYAFIPRDNATTERAVYEIQHQDGETKVIIDQHKLYDEWVELGQFVFDEQATQCVILTDKTDEVGLKRRIGFDAVKWVFLGER